MNWKPLFEELCFRLLGKRESWARLFIGIILSFVPVANLFAFGYLYRFTRIIHTTGELELPEWSDWKGLLTDGLKFAVVWLVYWLLPVICMLILAMLLREVGLVLIGLILVPLVGLYVTLLFCAALYRSQTRDRLLDFRELPLLLQITKGLLRPMAIPLFSFYGLHVLVKPLYGFSFFIGFLLIMSYTVICLRTMETRKNQVL
jgi:hypothetical protein